MSNWYKKFLNATFREAQRHHLIAALKPFIPQEPATILDIGAGNGEFAWMLQQAMPQLIIQGVDVIERGKAFIPITLYDGHHLPFEDKSFDYVMIINMLHHTEDPASVLKEAIRVCRKGVLVKDHYADNVLDYYTLYAMEHANPNAGQLLQMPLKFYSEKEWNAIFTSVGLVCDAHADRFTSYGRFWDIFFGRRMHFIGKYHFA